jgi:hypothetical protein
MGNLTNPIQITAAVLSTDGLGHPSYSLSYADASILVASTTDPLGAACRALRALSPALSSGTQVDVLMPKNGGGSYMLSGPIFLGWTPTLG